MKAYLINLFGDEWGGGELWDMYQLFFNRQPFLKLIVRIIACFLVILGIIFTIIGAIRWKHTHSHPYLIAGASLILVAMALLFFHSVYPHVKLHYGKKKK